MSNKPLETREYAFFESIKRFEKKWVALFENKVVASGQSPHEVRQKARESGYEECVLYFVPSTSASLAPVHL